MSDTVTAPFTPEQVISLNDYQRLGYFHPFTCPRSHVSVTRFEELPDNPSLKDFAKDPLDADEVEELERDGKFHIWDEHLKLVAYPEGWVCPGEVCDYTQDWAHSFMADGSWRAFDWQGP